MSLNVSALPCKMCPLFFVLTFSCSSDAASIALHYPGYLVTLLLGWKLHLVSIFRCCVYECVCMFMYVWVHVCRGRVSTHIYKGQNIIPQEPFTLCFIVVATGCLVGLVCLKGFSLA